jgi:hypothetical protein
VRISKEISASVPGGVSDSTKWPLPSAAYQLVVSSLATLRVTAADGDLMLDLSRIAVTSTAIHRSASR